MVTDAALICASCGAEAFAGELFCENCGAELPGAVATEASTAPDTEPVPVIGAVVEPACASCGGAIAADGYCVTCGAPALKERDHWLEQPASWIAAVSDRGIRHHRNEDAMALSARPGPSPHASPDLPPGSAPGARLDGHPDQDRRAVLVVCDGVSSSMDPDIASLAAARVARDLLTAADPDSPSVAGRISSWTELLTQAAAVANAETVEVARNPTGRPGERLDSPPSCTFVAAVIDGPLVVIGWVGDSRAYWIPDSGPADQLTTDDSWATEQIHAGMPREMAEAAPQAHAITRWLGRDSPDVVPKCVAMTPDRAGWLLVCSDGLWNYCSPAAEVATLVRQFASGHGHDPVTTVNELVNWANAQGGQDNITVALARLQAPAVARPGQPATQPMS